ncbi:MAG TPA: VOC family protein [Methylomirabilota bacterium]|nr:VOC family protein [Methylomirabilota bacterium]
MTRRRVVLALALAAVLLGVPAPPARAQEVVHAVGPIGMTVADADRSIAFYAQVLGFEKVSDVEVWGPEYEQLQGVFGLRMRVVGMRLGDEVIELTEYLTPAGRPLPADSRGNDRWFQHVAIIVSDMDRAYARLREHRVRHVSPAPQRLPDWNAKAAGIRAFYFKDPDGHFLEILWFPDGKGDAKWHRATDRLFLGIDHTAIVVGNTETSLGFYRDALGLRVAGESENYGPEQEWLNNVSGARLRITTLRAAAGPGIELLEYRAPRNGRPIPGDLGANDIAHWQIRLTVADVGAARRAAEDGKGTLVSGAETTVPGAGLGFTRGVLLRDPDGHAVELVERPR